MLSQHTDLLGYAQPVVINLPDRVEPLRRTMDELASIAGRKLVRGIDVEVIRPRRFANPGRFGDIGTRQRLDAHLQAALLAERHGLDRVLIMEDDVAFGADWPSVELDLLAELDALDWDLACLGAPEATSFARVDASWSADGEDGQDAEARHWRRSCGIEGNSGAYLLSGQFVATWIDHLAAITVGHAGDELQGPMGPGAAMGTVTRVSPWTKRYTATTALVERRAPAQASSRNLVSRLPLLRRLVVG